MSDTEVTVSLTDAEVAELQSYFRGGGSLPHTSAIRYATAIAQELPEPPPAAGTLYHRGGGYVVSLGAGWYTYADPGSAYEAPGPPSPELYDKIYDPRESQA